MLNNEHLQEDIFNTKDISAMGFRERKKFGDESATLRAERATEAFLSGSDVGKGLVMVHEVKQTATMIPQMNHAKNEYKNALNSFNNSEDVDYVKDLINNKFDSKVNFQNIVRDDYSSIGDELNNLADSINKNKAYKDNNINHFELNNNSISETINNGTIDFVRKDGTRGTLDLKEHFSFKNTSAQNVEEYLKGFDNNRTNVSARIEANNKAMQKFISSDANLSSIFNDKSATQIKRMTNQYLQSGKGPLAKLESAGFTRDNIVKLSKGIGIIKELGEKKNIFFRTNAAGRNQIRQVLSSPIKNSDMYRGYSVVRKNYTVIRKTVRITKQIFQKVGNKVGKETQRKIVTNQAKKTTINNAKRNVVKQQTNTFKRAAFEKQSKKAATSASKKVARSMSNAAKKGAVSSSRAAAMAAKSATTAATTGTATAGVATGGAAAGGGAGAAAGGAGMGIAAIAIIVILIIMFIMCFMIIIFSFISGVGAGIGGAGAGAAGKEGKDTMNKIQQFIYTSEPEKRMSEVATEYYEDKFTTKASIAAVLGTIYVYSENGNVFCSENPNDPDNPYYGLGKWTQAQLESVQSICEQNGITELLGSADPSDVTADDKFENITDKMDKADEDSDEDVNEDRSNVSLTEGDITTDNTNAIGNLVKTQTWFIMYDLQHNYPQLFDNLAKIDDESSTGIETAVDYIFTYNFYKINDVNDENIKDTITTEANTIYTKYLTESEDETTTESESTETETSSTSSSNSNSK